MRVRHATPESGTSDHVPQKRRARSPCDRALSVNPQNQWLRVANVLRLQALRTARHLEGHLLAFGEGAEPVHLDRGVVAEHVFSALILHDEPKALRIVEPLHSTSCHVSTVLTFSSPWRKFPGSLRARSRTTGRFHTQNDPRKS